MITITITIRKHPSHARKEPRVSSTSSRGPVGPIDRRGCDLLVPPAGIGEHTSWHPCLPKGTTHRARASCCVVSATAPSVSSGSPSVHVPSQRRAFTAARERTNQAFTGRRWAGRWLRRHDDTPEFAGCCTRICRMGGLALSLYEVHAHWLGHPATAAVGPPAGLTPPTAAPYRASGSPGGGGDRSSG